jgi:molybdate transport system substrate-binding protein
MKMREPIEVFCAGAVKSAVTALAREFESATGNPLHFTFGAVGGLRAKALAEKPDVVILTEPVLKEMAAEGRVVRETIAALGKVGVGLAVQSHASTLDVSTPERLRDVLLAAKSVAYGDPAKGDSSGIHFATVLERLGIAQALQSRIRLAPMGLAVAEFVARGEAEIGATQATVILGCPGIKLAALLPDPLQHVTTYAAAVTSGSERADAATRFVESLGSAHARASFARAGLQ